MGNRLTVPIKLLIVFLFSVVVTVVCYCLFQKTSLSVYWFVGQSFFAVVLQFAVMYTTAPVVTLVFRRNFNEQNLWFREKNFEKSLYRYFRIKSWKRFLPSYDKNLVSLSKQPLLNVIRNMCHFEMVHELSALLGFLPLLLTLFGLDFWILLAVSFVFCLIHTMFALVQRYNRPRMIRIFKNKK